MGEKQGVSSSRDLATTTGIALDAALLSAADLIAPEGAWTQRELARDANRASVAPESPEAVCWCMFGALQRVCGSETSRAGHRLYYRAFEVIEGVHGPIGAWWNDDPDRTQAEVVALLRAAASSAMPAPGDKSRDEP